MAVAWTGGPECFTPVAQLRPAGPAGGPPVASLALTRTSDGVLRVAAARGWTVYVSAVAEAAMLGRTGADQKVFAEWTRAVPSPAALSLAWAPGGGALVAGGAGGALHCWRFGGGSATAAPSPACATLRLGGGRYGHTMGVATSPCGFAAVVAAPLARPDKVTGGALALCALEAGPLAAAAAPDAAPQAAGDAADGALVAADAAAQRAAAQAAAGNVARTVAAARPPGAALWDAACALRVAAAAGASAAAALAPLHAPLAAAAASDASRVYGVYGDAASAWLAGAQASVALRRALLHGAGSAAMAGGSAELLAPLEALENEMRGQHAFTLLTAFAAAPASPAASASAVAAAMRWADWAEARGAEVRPQLVAAAAAARARAKQPARAPGVAPPSRDACPVCATPLAITAAGVDGELCRGPAPPADAPASQGSNGGHLVARCLFTLAPRGAPRQPEWACGGCAGALRGALAEDDGADEATAARVPPCCPICGTRMRRATQRADPRAFLTHNSV